MWDPSSCSTVDFAKLANVSLSLGEDICIRMSICYIIQTDSPIKAKTKQLLEKKNLCITLVIQIAISFWDSGPEPTQITQLGKPHSFPSWMLQSERKGFSPGFLPVVRHCACHSEGAQNRLLNRARCTNGSQVRDVCQEGKCKRWLSVSILERATLLVPPRGS